MVAINDVTLRDGHQSLLAGRMRQEDLLRVAKPLARAGFETLEVWGGTTYDIPIRFKGEDPWENLRQLTETIRTEAEDANKRPPKLSMLLRGQNLVGYRQYPDDVVEAFITHAAKNGIQVFRIFDALNDVRNLESSLQAIQHLKQKGFKIEAQGTICYTTSPVHTIDGFVAMGKELVAKGCDSICIKDMAGLLEPNEARELVSKLKEALPGKKLVLHMHAGMGKSDASIRAAIEAGVDAVETASLGLSGGSGHSATETTLDWLKRHHPEKAPNLDEAALAEATQALREIRPKYHDYESAYRPKWETLLHEAQVPGGMLTTLESQVNEQAKDLTQIEREILLEATIRHIPHVRADFGFVPLVTPTSQIVGTQAVLNVLNTFRKLKQSTGTTPSGTEIASYLDHQADTYRYKDLAGNFRLSQESARLLTGHYGRLPTDPERGLYVQACQISAPVNEEDSRPSKTLPPEMPAARAHMSQLEEAGHNSPDVEGDALTLALWGNAGLRYLNYRDNRGAPSERMVPNVKVWHERYVKTNHAFIKGPRDIADAVLPVIEKYAQIELEWQRLDSQFVQLSDEERDYRKTQLETARAGFGEDINQALARGGFNVTQRIGSEDLIQRMVDEYYDKLHLKKTFTLRMDDFKESSFTSRAERPDSSWAQGAA